MGLALGRVVLVASSLRIVGNGARTHAKHAYVWLDIDELLSKVAIDSKRRVS
jgi:hypothetical protein